MNIIIINWNPGKRHYEDLTFNTQCLLTDQ